MVPAELEVAKEWQHQPMVMHSEVISRQRGGLGKRPSKQNRSAEQRSRLATQFTCTEMRATCLTLFRELALNRCRADALRAGDAAVASHAGAAAPAARSLAARRAHVHAAPAPHPCAPRPTTTSAGSA